MKNRNLVIGLVLGVAILIAIYIYMRNGCIRNVIYTPASGNSVYKEDEYYSFLGGFKFDKFKTKNEAVSFCMSKKFSSDN